MALSDNQTTDIFQKTIGRAPTPYEISKYSKASSQDLANLKDIYGKQDPNSLVGYLGSTGQDFSLPAMQGLAKQYGITNFGTDEGNKALLAALKGGAPTTTPVGGSITSPAVDLNTPISGSITGATVGNQNPEQPVDNSKPQRVEGIDTALADYNDKRKQIADIDNTLKKMEDDIKNEAARSGGFLSASDLKSLVYERSKPMLEHRRELASDQATAGKTYTDLLARQKESDANFYKTKTLAQGDKKMAQQNTQFEQSLAQRGIKYLKFTDPDTGQTYYIDQSTGKQISGDGANGTTGADQTTTTQATVTNPDGKTHNLTGYATDPNHAAGIQSAIDSMGKLSSAQDITNYINKVAPNSPITSQMVINAAGKFGVDWETIMGIMQQESQFGTAGVAVSTHNPGNVGNIDSGAKHDFGNWQDGVNAIADWVSSHDKNPNIPDWTSSDANLVSTPEAGNKEAFWTDPATGKMVDTGRPINYIQQAAMVLAVDKTQKLQTFLGGLSGSSGPGKALKNAISQKSSAILAKLGTDPTKLQAAYSAASSALKKQVGDLNTIASSLATAEKNASQIQELFSGKKINLSDSTIANKTLNDLSSTFATAEEIKAYKGALQDLSQDYSSVFARTGQRSVASDKNAKDILDGNISVAAFKTITDTLNTLGEGAITARKGQIDSLDAGGELSRFYSYFYPNTDGSIASVNDGSSVKIGGQDFKSGATFKGADGHGYSVSPEGFFWRDDGKKVDADGNIIQ